MNDSPKLGDCQRGLSSLIRPHFTEGLLLQDDDLTAGVTYTRALSRMLFRTLFGCGVLCGLGVKVPPPQGCKLRIEVERGLALDCLGDPVELPKSVIMEVEIPSEEKELWVALKQKEKCCAPRTAMCSPDDDEPPSVCTRERDEYALCVFTERPPCSCGCTALAPPPAPGKTDPPTKKSEPKASTAAPDTASASTQPPPSSPSSGTPTEPPVEPWPAPGTPCLCNQRTAKGACYDKHYHGDCPCDCCECEWIVLAKATVGTDGVWKVDHSVRRFVRPVLMRDPLVV